MKKFVALIGLAFLLVGGVAQAASPFTGRRDFPDGRSVWTKDRGQEQVPIGDTGLTVRISDVSEASTTVILTNRSGLLVKVYGVLQEALASASNSPSLTFWYATAASANADQWTQVSDQDGAAMTWSTTSVVGANTSLTLDNEAGTDTRSIGQGGVIAIVSDGGSTGVARAEIVLVIE